MLYSYILLSSKAASHQAVEYFHLLHGQTKHWCCLMLCVEDTLVCGIDPYSILCGNGKGAFRLKEGMLRIRGSESCRVGEGRAGYGRFRVSTGDVALLGKV